MEGLEELTSSIASVLADEPVAFAYLFGSVARGEARPDSDVDVAVHFEPGLAAQTRFDLTLSIGVELERALGRQVDAEFLRAMTAGER